MIMETTGQDDFCCRTCVFWDEDRGGECHRNPPVPALVAGGPSITSSDFNVVWPRTLGSDWCGEWEDGEGV